MNSDEEFIMQFSDSEKQPERKLKRLKRATDDVTRDPLPIPSPDDNAPSSFHDVNSKESLDRVEANAQEELEEIDARDKSRFEAFKDLDSGFDSLDVEGSRPGAKRALGFDCAAEDFDVEGGDLTATEVQVENKINHLDGIKEKREKKKNKKKRAKSAGDDGYDENISSAAPNKRRRDKERRERLKDLRSESQKLLRETRDASFKPLPFVQKSVSSVLEKIRQRKHELSRKSVIDVHDTITREVTLDFDFENSPIKDKVTEADNEERTGYSVDGEGSSVARSAQGSREASNNSHKSLTPQMALAEDTKQTFRAPIDDTQDLIFDSQTSEFNDELSDEMPSSPLEDVMAPSFLVMDLKLDSAPPDEFSSDEEENDKENIDPFLRGLVDDLPSSPKGDPVKAFVDDEAEEEDDSDNDLARFKDNEEDEDIMDSEELNEIIATGYEEKPVDNDLRNQLHQKWLEQQDAAGTENLLHRLKCNSKQRQIEEEEDEESEEVEEEFLDDPAEYLGPRNAVRMNLKKAKEMICQMFTDKDVYVSSDDEETEERLAKQNLSDKSEKQAKFLSPAEDEGCRGIFSRIKKLNGVLDTRRRAKISSHFHTLSIGGDKTAPSKSSFLSRRSRNSLPSVHKHGTSTVRSFVFERDDSNSRSAISMSEDSLDAILRT
ncbi:glutamic acid-rich protein isoform X2 [Ricinus communis]|uniref:glutamic acid-rich protein isoform X2 n=1 Tax=Ricinus communis TaxID=3988 RepID=UPI00201B2F4A|nr:glutamic acid-rich protein isoform X2 [Ricinus communis]